MKVVNIIHKIATGSNRNGKYSISTTLTDSNLSRNEFTILFTYVQIDVKRNIPLVDSIKFPKTVKILKLKRCGEELDHSPDVLRSPSSSINFRQAISSLAQNGDPSPEGSDAETSHCSAQIPDYHTKLSSPHEQIIKEKGGPWITVNSNSVDNIFLEPPKNNRIYSFYLIIECESTVRGPYFDITRNDLTMDSKCILLNEENSEGSECAEFFIEGVGNLRVYKVIIDEYVISSNCKSLVLKSMFSDTLSKIKSYKIALATVRDPSLDTVRKNVKVVVSIDPDSVSVTPMNGVFIADQILSLRAVFYYPIKS